MTPTVSLIPPLVSVYSLTVSRSVVFFILTSLVILLSSILYVGLSVSHFFSLYYLAVLLFFLNF
jgi:hypothetical protein